MRFYGFILVKDVLMSEGVLEVSARRRIASLDTAVGCLVVQR